METNSVPSGKRARINEPIKLKDIDSALRYMDKLLDNLKGRAEILPEVSKSGESECPFAEMLYASKEKAQKEASEQLNELQGFLDPLKKEIARCEKNLALIQQDSHHLRLIESKEDYSHAEGSFRIHYNTAVNLKKNLFNLIARAKVQLRKAEAKKWPLGIPNGSANIPQFGYGETTLLDNPGHYRSALSSPLHVNQRFNKEIDSLMALGPIAGPQIGMPLY